jgi:LAO/AO transport system kinase
MEEINLDALARGDIEVLAHAISRAENGALSTSGLAKIHELANSSAASSPDQRGRRRIGITGTPGVGKSTLTSLLIKEFRSTGAKVGVLAVDPSSVVTGGALLGDRIRMQEHYVDPEVFIRSMSARGHLGGLSVATPLAIELLTIAGYAPVIVETVGVGQSEVEVMNYVDTTIVVLAPGAGDDIQSAKAGILEIADIFIINKIDRDKEGSEKLRQDLLRSQELSQRSDGWRAPVLLVSALDRTGISEVMSAIGDHQDFMERVKE